MIVLIKVHACNFCKDAVKLNPYLFSFAKGVFMSTILLVIHMFVTIFMIGMILLQKSEGAGLGATNTNFLNARGAANLLTRTTAILAALFYVLALVLGMIAGRESKAPSILDKAPVAQESQAAPATKEIPALPAVEHPAEAPKDVAPAAPQEAAPVMPQEAAPEAPKTAS